jgi:hypothetical protein
MADQPPIKRPSGAARRKSKKTMKNILADLRPLEVIKEVIREDKDGFFKSRPMIIRGYFHEYPVYGFYQIKKTLEPVRIIGYTQREVPPRPQPREQDPGFHPREIDRHARRHPPTKQYEVYARAFWPMPPNKQGYEFDCQWALMSDIERVYKWTDAHAKMLEERVGKRKALRFMHPDGFCDFSMRPEEATKLAAAAAEVEQKL